MPFSPSRHKRMPVGRKRRQPMPCVLHLNTGTRLSGDVQGGGFPGRRQSPEIEETGRRNIAKWATDHILPPLRSPTTTTFDESRFMARVYGRISFALALSVFPACATDSTPRRTARESPGDTFEGPVSKKRQGDRAGGGIPPFVDGGFRNEGGGIGRPAEDASQRSPGGHRKQHAGAGRDHGNQLSRRVERGARRVPRDGPRS